MNFNCALFFFNAGHATPQAVNRRPQTAEDRLRPQASSWDICTGQSGTEKGSPPSVSVAFHCQYHHTDADSFMFTSLITAILANEGVFSLICNVDKFGGNDLTGMDEQWYRFLTFLEA